MADTDTEKDITKEQYETIANIITAVGTETAGGSAKERAASLKKTLDNQAELLKVFRGGIPVDLGTADKKAIMSAAQTAGIDVTEKQEDSAEDTQRFLVNLAFKAKREDLKAAKLKAKEDENLTKQAGLHMKGLWMDATQKITNGLLDIRENIAKNTDISNLTGAFSQEMSMLSMAFQGVMEAPGMKLIVASIKYIAAWIAKAMWPMIQRFYMMMVKDRIKRKVAKAEGTYHNIFKRAAMFFGYKGHIEDLEDPDTKKSITEKRKESKKTKIADQETAMWKEKEDAEGKEKKAWQNLGEKGTPDMFPETLWQKISRKFYEIGDNIKTGAGKLAGAVKGIFINKDTNELTKVGKFFKDAKDLFLRGLQLLVKSFKNAAKAIGRVVKRFAIVMAQFLFQVGLFIVNMIVAIAGFIVANLPLIALIALVVLIAVGLFFLIKYLMDNWEKIKVRFNKAVDKFKQAFTKMSNWFTDLGEDIVYKIKWLIAKIKDGIASMANKVITKLNKIPGVNIEKWDAGRTEKLEGEHENKLAGRIDHDQKLLGEYKALSVERGKQLEDAAKADAERKADKDAIPEGGNQQVNTSIQTDAREVHMSSESTQPTDFIGMRANMALDG